MSSTTLSPEAQDASPISTNIPSNSKPHKVLACVQCSRRKVKCDRHFPCENCTKAGVSCVPSSANPRQRRRRFAERELLERLRHYESLLRRHNIDFAALHPDSSSNTDGKRNADADTVRRESTRSTADPDEAVLEQSRIKPLPLYEPTTLL
jgi:hypothetical protein